MEYVPTESHVREGDELAKHPHFRIIHKTERVILGYVLQDRAQFANAFLLLWYDVAFEVTCSSLY
jgi:hypothetical protein